MLTHKKSSVLIAGIVILAMLAVFIQAGPPMVKADSLTDAKDTISDSDLIASSSHSISFVIGEALYVSELARVEFAPGFDITNATVVCGNAEFKATTTYGQTVGCEVDIGNTIATTSTITITIYNVTNPDTAGDYTIGLSTRSGPGDYVTVKESQDVKVYIIDDVVVTASVDSTLSFTVGALASGQTINGVTTTDDAATTTIAFGTLSDTSSSTIGQYLSVSTNADDGYSVTVEQDQELTSAAGVNINSFNNSPDGTGSTTPAGWAAPLETLDATYTYGHMGLTTDDADLGTDFTNSKYAGLNGNAAMEIMSHTGPSDGTTQNEGYARVAYTVEITSLQESGDYTNTLTYICTPQY